MNHESSLRSFREREEFVSGDRSGQPTSLFVELVVRHQHDVNRFIRILGLKGEDAEEVLQQTMVKVWEKWDEYDPDRDFLPWILKFAHLEVLKFRQRRTQERLIFNDEVLQAIAMESIQNPALYEAKLEVLRGCLQRLRRWDYELVLAKYGRGLSATELAAQASTTTKAIYRKLDRIRMALTECMRAGMVRSDP